MSPLPDPSMRPRPSFPLTHFDSQLLAQSSFKGPAHKHAHHLHSIPPREKSTRSLIIDHLLWLHGKARFAQARSELGMNISDAEADEDTSEVSEAERVEALGYGLNSKDVHMAIAANEELAAAEKHQARARAFKARADGLEKVLYAMLEQPPEDLPFDHDDILFRDTSFSVSNQPTLPNGVRLRISIAALINDFFTDDTIKVNSDVEFRPDPPFHPSPPPFSTYTPTLQLLSQVSSFARLSDLPTLPSINSLTSGVRPHDSAPILPPPGSIFFSIPRGAGPESPWALGSSTNARNFSGARVPSIPGSSRQTTRYPISLPMDIDTSSTPPPPPRVFRAIGRSRELFNAGCYAYPTRGGETPRRPTRCARHLSQVCPPYYTCSGATHSGPSNLKHRNKSSIGAGLSVSGPPLRRPFYVGTAAEREARSTDLLIRFLRLSALVATELGREARGEEVDMLSRMDLKRKEPEPSDSRRKADSDEESGERSRSRLYPSARPSRAWYALLAGLLTQATLHGYLVKGWRGTDAAEILLGVGLGPRPGSSSAPKPSHAPSSSAAANPDAIDVDEDEEEVLMEPDQMPDLVQAWSVLFGATPGQTGGEAYEEYEKVMADRISEFFSVAPNAGDLSSHLEDLRSKYKSEPVERAAVRFSEAVAQWRGRPELETVRPDPVHSSSSPSTYDELSYSQYKSPNAGSPSPNSPVASSSSSIHALLQPQQSPRPLIEHYFMIPKPSEYEKRPRRDSESSVGTAAKRSRRNSWADSGKGKKVVIDQAWIEEEEYVGPYGV